MPGKARRIIRKYYEYIITKVKLVYSQKKFKSGDVTLKYIIEKNSDSKNLIVVFSSCTRRGIKARYNYMRTLSKIKANKLFILDDFASDHRGSYYLGYDLTYLEEKATVELINIMKKKLKTTKLISCGSSKGGYSAINFGLQFSDSYIVAGGPQFYLGQYLVASQNIECLEHIIGSINDEKIHRLDVRLKERIEEKLYGNKQKIFLHFSNKEHTYEEHIKDLLKSIKDCGYTVESDIADYTDHSEISYYFPDYLVKTISKILIG